MGRILLIEPNRILALSYRAALERAGHVVDWQKGAQASIASLDKHTADLVILEPQLAGHNGIEFLHELRSYADWVDLPVVFLTLIAPEKLPNPSVLAHEYGVAGVLYKPRCSLKSLVDFVAAQLSVHAVVG